MLGALLAVFSRGPVGQESIVAKDVQSLIADSAKSVNALARGPTAIVPSQVPLELELEVKRVLKTVYSSADERAEAYLIEYGKLISPVRCLVRLRGDHVISVAVEESAPQELKQAIRSRFAGYRIHEFGTNLKLQRTPTAPLT